REAHAELDGNVKAVARDGEIGVVAGAQIDRPAVGGLEREHQRHEQLGAVASIRVGEADLEVGVGGDRVATAGPAGERAERDGGLVGIDVADQEARACGERERALEHAGKGVEAAAVIGVVTRKLLSTRDDADASAGCDSIYAVAAVNE